MWLLSGLPSILQRVKRLAFAVFSRVRVIVHSANRSLSCWRPLPAALPLLPIQRAGANEIKDLLDIVTKTGPAFHCISVLLQSRDDVISRSSPNIRSILWNYFSGCRRPRRVFLRDAYVTPEVPELLGHWPRQVALEFDAFAASKSSTPL